MLSALHVVSASVVVVADVGDLLVDSAAVVLLPLVVVILVAVVLVWVLVVLVLLGDLEDNLVLLLLVKIVWVDELELRVVAYVIKLLHGLILLDDVKHDSFLLDEELWILVLQEGSEVLVLPLRGLLWVQKVLSVHHLELVVAEIRGEVRVLHKLGIQMELMSGEWINGEEGQHVSLWVLDVAYILDSLLQDFVLA